MCILFVYFHYDWSVLSMSVTGFQRKSRERERSEEEGGNTIHFWMGFLSC